MTPGEAFALFLATWIIAYTASMTANNLKRFRFRPEELAHIQPGTVQFLVLLRLVGVLKPVVAGIVGLFRLKWYLVLAALPLTFVGAFYYELDRHLWLSSPTV
jgi:hypothetical protein